MRGGRPSVAAYLASGSGRSTAAAAIEFWIEEGTRQRGRSRSFSVEPTVTLSFAANPPAISRTWRTGESGP